MAWDLGCGDIIAGIRIALTLYEYGFVEENAPDYIYRDFRNDILNFGLLLERLNRSLRDAERRYHDGGLFNAAWTAYDPLDEKFEAERIAIVGNFKETLRDCERVLKDNERFKAHYANAFESLEWHLTQQKKRIDDLRRRLYFHCEKIRLVIDRLSIKLLTEADSKLDDILAVTSENLQLSQDILDELQYLRYTLVGDRANCRRSTDLDVHTVSPALARRFEEAFTIDAPDTFTSDSDLPLIEAFDALYFRFEQSVQGSTQTPEKYLHLLKCRWLLAQIKASRQYHKAAPAFYYRRAVNQVDLAIRIRVLRSGDLVTHEESELLALPDDLFNIWLQPPEPEPAATIPLQPNPTIKRANERQIAQIELASDGLRAGDIVTVFQHTDENFRIALETSTATGERYILTQQLYTREHRLIPRYALPTLPDPVPEVAIFSHNESNFYRFSKYEDLWKFQTALTGYEVSHDQPEVRCQFGRSLDSFVCSGRAQLWQDPIVFTSQLSDLETSVRSTHGPTTTRDSPRTRGFAPSLAHTANISTTPNGLIAENIKFSALVIFTQLDHWANDNRFAVIFLELLENVYIDREACACTKKYDKCPKLVISARKNGRLPVRMVLSNMDAGGPDPNSFDILPLRLPRRPDYRTIKVREGELVVLKFPNLNAKKQFDVELQYRFAVRDRQRQMQNEITKILTYNSNHPMRREEYLAQNYARRASDTDWFRSPPPQLAEPEIGPPFEIAITQDMDPGPTRDSHRVSGSTSMSTSPPTNGSPSISSTNSSNSTNNINWALRKEVALSPSSPPRKPSAGLNEPHMSPSATEERASIPGLHNLTTPDTSDHADRLRRKVTTQLQAAQPDRQGWFRSSPPRRATEGDILPAGFGNRRDSAATSRSSYQTAPARTTEPTMQRQEDPSRRRTGQSKKTTGLFGAASYVLRNR